MKPPIPSFVIVLGLFLFGQVYGQKDNLTEDKRKESNIALSIDLGFTPSQTRFVISTKKFQADYIPVFISKMEENDFIDQGTSIADEKFVFECKGMVSETEFKEAVYRIGAFEIYEFTKQFLE